MHHQSLFTRVLWMKGETESHIETKQQRHIVNQFIVIMGNMHVLPTEADLHSRDEKCDPIKGFVGINEHDPKWETGCKFCNSCSEPFDAVFLRKHHCRVCGKTFCTRCCPKRHLLSQVRGCGKCTVEMMMDLKGQMLEEHNRAAASPRMASPPRPKGPSVWQAPPAEDEHPAEEAVPPSPTSTVEGPSPRAVTPRAAKDESEAA